MKKLINQGVIEGKCLLCGGIVNLKYETYGYDFIEGYEENTYYKAINGVNNGKDDCICQKCLDQDDKLLQILKDSSSNYIETLQTRANEIKKKYEKKMQDEINEETKYTKEIEKILEKLSELHSIGDLEENELDIIYNHYNKPQVPYTKLHFLIKEIHDNRYRAVHKNKKKFSEWVGMYELNNYHIYGNGYMTKDEFLKEVMQELDANDKNFSVKDYREIMNKLKIVFN